MSDSPYMDGYERGCDVTPEQWVAYCEAQAELEAQIDPEVQRMVFDNWQVRQAWMFTNSQVRRTREVTDDE